MTHWHIFKKNETPHNNLANLPYPPEWRKFGLPSREEYKIGAPVEMKNPSQRYRGENYRPGDTEVEMVNTALFLRRPLLITGDPGTGKSSLAYAVAHQLKLGDVLYWPISTRSTLQDALYEYDAIGRLQETRLTGNTEDRPDIGGFITLGPLGTALLPSDRPRAILIDEIDKSDIDLPNDLLNVLEEGGFEIRELQRAPEGKKGVTVRKFDNREITVTDEKILCRQFPFVIITSNGERELPAPFLRRCLRLEIDPPNDARLAEIVDAHFGRDEKSKNQRKKLIDAFMEKVNAKKLVATDQLLNAIYLAGCDIDVAGIESLREAVLRQIGETERT